MWSCKGVIVLCGSEHCFLIKIPGDKTSPSAEEPEYNVSADRRFRFATDLLASLMSAMAIRSLFLRKMRSRMMMTSMIARMITAKQEKG